MSKLNELLQTQAKLTEEVEALSNFIDASHGHHKMILQVGPETKLLFEKKDLRIREIILDVMHGEMNRLSVMLEETNKKVDAVEALL